MKKFGKLFFIVALFILIGAINAYATDEEINVEESTINQADITAPVFDSNIKTRYTVKKVEDGSVFNPEEIITDIKATDDVDGKNVTISLAYNSVDLSQDGEYQVMYTATDRAGNMSYIIIAVDVDGIAPVFDENTENLYYMNKAGTVFDSKYNVVESLPKTLIAKEALGAYRGIGVYITTDGNGNIIFVDMIKNTPAEKVLAINDILVKVDGEDVRNKTPDYVASKIKGDEGTTVQLEVIRNQETFSVTVERELIKLHGEVDCIAEPNISIDSINKDQSGTIEIIYTVTDEVGNTAEFVVKVIVIEEETPDLYVNGKEGVVADTTNNVTTSGNPPEDVTLENPTEKVDALDTKIQNEKTETDTNIDVIESKEEIIENDVEKVIVEEKNEEITTNIENME